MVLLLAKELDVRHMPVEHHKGNSRPSVGTMKATGTAGLAGWTCTCTDNMSIQQEQ